MLIPFKSPHLLIRPIDENYFYAVNCAYPNSLRVLNRAQYDIIRAIDNRTSVKALGKQLSIPTDTLNGFLRLLSQTEIIRFDDQFSEPKKPASPKSLNFWIHTTNRCNLSCSYCYISTLNTTSGMIDTTRRQLLNKLVETVTKRELSSIKLRLAGGEPLTQFKSWQAFIPEARNALNALRCDLTFSFISNLTILTDEMVDFSKEHNISYGVSLDGLASDHDATRTFRSGTGSFNIVDRNLRTLIAHNIPVSTNTVVTNCNLEGLPGLTRYLIGLDIPFRYSIVKGEAIDSELLETCLLTSYAIMGEAIQGGWRFSSRHQFCDLKPNELGFQTCASGFSGGAIYVDGTLNYCHVHFGDETQLSHSIFETGLDLVDMIEQGSHYEDMKSPDCLSCRYKSVCTSGCAVYRINGKDPHCGLYHKVIPLIYELQARERLKVLQYYGMM
ncbi:radical SAM/SPASM domain-containing protein [Spirosoma pollinicola]|uniref:Radical SAM protein n=1 Tax=Spirosoma pollinicola TaxID=2057025 RepID=A0A2K8YX02_9BACT|nr:radical SAM protein [Spirosoma pollinicola]AUD02162.1 radical SAM protein [Spirosoma pollinicola]